MNFKEAYETVQSYVNRKDNLAVVKAEINSAVRYATQAHQFKYAEGLTRVNYPANELYVDINNLCGGRVMQLLSVQALPNPEAIEGTPLRIRSYDMIQADRLYARNEEPMPIEDYHEYESSYISRVSRRHSHYVFLADSGMGLYPSPSEDKCLLINYSKELPLLVNDSDTNFLLKYGRDFVIDRAVARLSLYLQKDNRLEALSGVVAGGWAELIEWDRRVRLTSDLL